MDTHVISLGAQLIWGDSMATAVCPRTGVEHVAEVCEVGEGRDDLLPGAIANGLDFAAITDHAELGLGDASYSGEQVSIWETQSIAQWRRRLAVYCTP